MYSLLAVFELVSATVKGVVILTFPPDVNVLHSTLRNTSLLCNVSVNSSYMFSFCLVEGNTTGFKG